MLASSPTEKQSGNQLSHTTRSLIFLISEKWYQDWIQEPVGMTAEDTPVQIDTEMWLNMVNVKVPHLADLDIYSQQNEMIPTTVT